MIVVFGTTGTTGIPLVAELVRRGHSVRATARDLAAARDALARADVDPERVELVACDLQQEHTIAPALEGAERCYAAIGGPRGTPELVAVEQRLIDTARRCGVRHYVKVSGVDARPDSPSVIQRWHGQIVEHLLASGMGYTVLEPAFFMQNLLGLAPVIASGVLPLPTGDGRAAIIDARDIAMVAAEVLGSDDHLGRRYVLTGPQSLTHGEVAERLSALLGRPVSFVDVPAEAFIANLTGAGLPPWFAALLGDVYDRLYRTNLLARVTDDVQQVTGRAPRDLEAFLRDHRAVLAG